MARQKSNKQQIEVQGKTLTVANLEKVYFPVAGFTKGELIHYYIRVAEYMLPHLKDRPVTLKRFPDGVEGDFFYEKNAPGYTPEWVKRFPVPRRAGGSDINYILVNDLATLVWCANIGTIEFHTFLHRAPEIERPSEIVFDLDPGEGSTVLDCVGVAFLLREVLNDLKLKSFPKMSGSKGIQIYVPLNTPATYDVTQTFARTLARLLEHQHPKLIISEMAKDARKNKVFIDWSQNADFKTTVGAYSMRAKRQHPFISVPVSWEELEQARANRESSGLYFQPEAALERFKTVGDLFAPVLKLKQRLPKDFVARFEARKTAAATLPSRTREPEPAPARASRQGGRRRFVIQKHAASHLHYDFRLEMHGVLKSWAVPKGVPYALDEKRLAMATEDHPIEYLEFEGNIPKGQYGGGTVMVWDIGTYEIVEGNYYKGYLHVFLEGKKLKGDWMLRRDEGTAQKQWRIVKIKRGMKPVRKDDQSALSGRTMDRIAADNNAQWESNRTQRVLQSR